MKKLPKKGDIIVQLSLPSAEKLSLLKENHLTIDDIDFIIPHQASETAIKAYSKFGGFPESKVMNIIGQYGNCVSVSIPLALSIAIEERKINRGDIVMMIGTGAGLSVTCTLIKF